MLEDMKILVDISDIFNFSAIFIENPRRGVSRRERGRAAGRVSAANWGGGGAKYFFSGPQCPPRNCHVERNSNVEMPRPQA